MSNALILGIAWAGVMMLYNFTMWEGNIFERWGNELDYWGGLGKTLGACTVCCGFWWGLLVFLYLHNFHADRHLLVFTGTSEGILVLYSCMMIRWFK